MNVVKSHVIWTSFILKLILCNLFLNQNKISCQIYISVKKLKNTIIKENILFSPKLF